MKKSLFEISLLIGLALSLIVGALAKEEQADISKKLIRLHIVANSNSETDQTIKLLIRDEILSYMTTLTKKAQTKEEISTTVKENLQNFEAIANRICREKNVSYRAVAELSETRFPTKEYDGFSLPAGRYNALVIRLGKGSGKNWWCVLFPPLCFSAAEAEDALKSAGLSEKEILLTTSDKPEYRVKFKLLELINGVMP